MIVVLVQECVQKKDNQIAVMQRGACKIDVATPFCLESSNLSNNNDNKYYDDKISNYIGNEVISSNKHVPFHQPMFVMEAGNACDKLVWKL